MRRLTPRVLVLAAGVGLLALALARVGGLGVGSLADCALRYDRADRAACRARLGLAAHDDLADVWARLDATSDDTERDLLILRLVMDDPRRARRLCARTVDPRMRAWCLDIQGRTHLLSEEGAGP